MDTWQRLRKATFTTTQNSFEQRALTLFYWQAERNSTYRRYLQYLGVDPREISQVSQIPFLPIDLFKRHRVLSVADDVPIEVVFESSGTTQLVRSQHHVPSVSFYHRVCRQIFEQRFGPLTDFHIVALLPSYLERKNASLVSMVDHFIQRTRSAHSGFYLADYPKLIRTLDHAQSTKRQVMLIGVTFALLQLAERYAPNLREVIVLETGGMKGMRKELTRAEVYQTLRDQTGAQRIYSEYGMTELLSQAYTKSSGRFIAPSWMKIITREVDDPFAQPVEGRVGGINIIDLANVHSCAFIETMDQGRLYYDGTFEILGRIDNSDVRGCNTMVEG